MWRRELAVAAVVFLAGSASWGPRSFAAAPTLQAKPAPARPADAVAAALCGRKVEAAGMAARAEALDAVDARKLLQPWRRAKARDVEVWLTAPSCPNATPEETALASSRRAALKLLQSLVERARAIEAITADVARLPERKLNPAAWPALSVCRLCDTLRAADSRIAELTVTPWPEATKGEQTPLGERFAAAAKREPMVDALCGVKPPPGARAEIEQRFLYYSWTANGARLLDVAELFERPSLASGCPGR